MNVRTILSWLERTGTPETIEGMSRYGIPSERAFGVPMGVMKKYARGLGKRHSLAAELWETGWYEARTVAVFLSEAERVTGNQMESWAHDFDSWAICDTTCFHLFDRTPHAWPKVREWADAEPEFVRRASFALIWGLTTHDKEAADEAFLDCLPLIEAVAQDDRKYVMKAVDMALRAIGKRNRRLNGAAVETAQRVMNSDDSTAQWIGRHALRELESANVQMRLDPRRKPIVP